MMHGHWDIRESDLNKPTIAPELRHGVNIGIGIVVPAEKILETINQPRLVEFRAEANTRYVREAKTSKGGPAVGCKKGHDRGKKSAYGEEDREAIAREEESRPENAITTAANRCISEFAQFSTCARAGHSL
jgi:hypothetical protein